MHGVSGLPGAVPSGRGPAAAHAEGRGFFLHTEMAVVGVIVMTLALISAFYVGVRVGRREAGLSGGTRGDKDGKVAGGLEEGIKNLAPGKVEHDDVGGRPKRRVDSKIKVPVGKGRWTVEVIAYERRASAENMVRRLASRYKVTGARVERRGRLYSVCLGRFERADDPRAIRLKRSIIAKNPGFGRATGIVRLR